MTAKRFTYDKPVVAFSKGGINDSVTGETYEFTMDTVLDLLNELHEENQQLKEDVEYWKQVASQYSNELNVFEHCKKYKTECKDIHWSSE